MHQEKGEAAINLITKNINIKHTGENKDKDQGANDIKHYTININRSGKQTFGKVDKKKAKDNKL